MIPKRIHLYWGKNQPLSYLRKLTVDTFAKLNPDWEINIWVPKYPSESKTWGSNEHSLVNTGFDYLTKLKNVKEFDFSTIGIPEDIPEVHKSDLLRWYLLGEQGGIWSDFDILYIKPITDELANVWKGAGLCKYECEPEDLRRHHAIGFLTSEGALGRLFYRQLFEFGRRCIPMPEYQAFGAHLLEAYIVYHWSLKETPFYLDADLVYPSRHCWSFLKYFEEEPVILSDVAIGLHWYGGNQECNAKELIITEKTIHKFDLAICRAALRIITPEIDIPEEKALVVELVEKPKYVKYSFIMPYYRRSEQLRSTLQSFVHHYSGRDDFEIIIAKDIKNKDSSDDEIKLKTVVQSFSKHFPISVIEYGAKDMWNPSEGFNLAAQKAKGEYLILTNPECFHKSDILYGLDHEFAINKNVYVVASCFSINKFNLEIDQEIPVGFWYQHSVHRNIRCHFCSALHKNIFKQVGGFDQRYSQGMGFDDDDFRNALKKEKVKFVLRDDLITIHLTHDGNMPKNYRELHGINQKYYNAKWGENSMRAEMYPLPNKRVDCLETL